MEVSRVRLPIVRRGRKLEVCAEGKKTGSWRSDSWLCTLGVSSLKLEVGQVAVGVDGRKSKNWMWKVGSRRSVVLAGSRKL
eukprot:6936002-Pyramimonas_sp.AAC.1